MRRMQHSAVWSLFTLATILVHPDVSYQFIMEIDTSDISVGAVLTQCQFFSPSEVNYDLGKVHNIPPDCCTYITGVQTLTGVTSCTTSIIPSSRTRGKHDTHSSWEASTSRSSTKVAHGTEGLMPCPGSSRWISPGQIPAPLSPSFIVGGAYWLLKEKVWRVQLTNVGPAGTSHNQFFVPVPTFFSHCSTLTCHLGLAQTLNFLKQWFWWPSMQQDTRSFLAAGPVCASGSHHMTKEVFLWEQDG